MGLYHVGFHVSDWGFGWGCGWGQNIHGCSPLCFSAVQDEQRAPRTTTSKNISGLAALGCAAGSKQNNGLKSFLKFLCGNIICPILELRSNLRVYHWVWLGLQDHDLAKCIWIWCFELCSSGEHTIQMGWNSFWWSILISFTWKNKKIKHTLFQLLAWKRQANRIISMETTKWQLYGNFHGNDLSIWQEALMGFTGSRFYKL